MRWRRLLRASCVARRHLASIAPSRYQYQYDGFVYDVDDVTVW